MRKCIPAHNSFIRLNRHIHQAGNHAAYRINFLCIDLSFNSHTCVAFQNHGHLFERSISGTFANAVDGNFHLPGAVQYSGNGVGCCHTQIVVTMSGNDSILNALYIFKQVFDFISVLPGQAVARGVGDVDHRSTGFNHGFNHTGQVHVVGSSGIFTVKFDIFHVFFGVFCGSYGTFENFFLCGVEFVLDMKI